MFILCIFLVYKQQQNPLSFVTFCNLFKMMLSGVYASIIFLKIYILSIILGPHSTIQASRLLPQLRTKKEREAHAFSWSSLFCHCHSPRLSLHVERPLATQEARPLKVLIPGLCKSSGSHLALPGRAGGPAARQWPAPG